VDLYFWLIVAFIAIYLSCQSQRRYRCPAPGCDWTAPGDREDLAKLHEAAHSKHKPVLKD
jgi:hypothetical protein